MTVGASVTSSCDIQSDAQSSNKKCRCTPSAAHHRRDARAVLCILWWWLIASTSHFSAWKQADG